MFNPNLKNKYSLTKNPWKIKGSYYLLVEAENEGSKDENKTFSLLNNKYPVGYKDFVVCSNNHEFKHLHIKSVSLFTELRLFTWEMLGLAPEIWFGLRHFTEKGCKFMVYKYLFNVWYSSNTGLSTLQEIFKFRSDFKKIK